MENKTIMAFDVSSSTIGWCVIEIDKKDNISLSTSGFIKPNKKGDIFSKLTDTKKEILDLLETYKPSDVAIEDIAQFMPKVSSANTIITLALYNRTVGLTVFDYLKKSPELYSVMAIRHGIKQNKELPKKEDIPNLVQKILDVTLPTRYTKTGSIKPEIYDEADAIACGLYHALKITNKLEAFKKARKNESARSI